MRPSLARVALFLALAAHVTGQSFLLVVLPPLGRRLGFTDLQTGAILSVSALLLIASAPVWGFVSERIGRKPVLLSALGGGALAWFVYSLIVDARSEGLIGAALALWLFLVSRALQTMASAGLLPAAQAYMADVTQPQNRTGGMGLVAGAYGSGTIAGAALAWAIGGDKTVLAFVVVAGLLVLAAAGLFSFLREPHPLDTARNSAAGRLQFNQLWPFLAITLLAFAAYSIVQQVMALRLQDTLGFSSGESISRAGAAMVAAAVTMTAVQAFVLHYSTREPERLLICGTLLAAICMLLCAYARTYPQIYGVFALFGISLGLILPANLASLSLRTGSGAQGKAAGINVVGQGMGLTIGPVAGAGLHQISAQAPFLVATFLLALASVCAFLAYRARRRPRDVETA